MTQKTPAYGARAAKGPVAPMNIQRRDPGPHDVEIDILFCGICHSDVHKVNDDWENTNFPVVPGHEIVGRVVSRGAGEPRFREGDLVGVGCIVDSWRAWASTSGTCCESRRGWTPRTPHRSCARASPRTRLCANSDASRATRSRSWAWAVLGTWPSSSQTRWVPTSPC